MSHPSHFPGGTYSPRPLGWNTLTGMVQRRLSGRRKVEISPILASQTAPAPLPDIAALLRNKADSRLT